MEKKREQIERAHAAGFSNAEEYEKHLMDEWAEEALRRLEKHKIKKTHEKTKRALAAGFSNAEEYDKHLRDAWQERQDAHDRRIEEQCAVRGISTEEYYTELYRDHPQLPVEPPMREPCDCEGQSSHSLPP